MHALRPSAEECLLLSQRYSIPLEYLQAALDENERPRLEHCENCMLLLIRVPVHDPKNKNVLFITCPVAIIITESVAITVCLRENVVENLISRGLKGNCRRRQVQLTLTLLFRASTLFIDNLRHMNELVSVIERTLHKSMQNSELINMLRIEKSLTFSFMAIKGNHATMEKFKAYPLILLTSDEKELLDDVLIENKQASDMAEVFSLIIGSVSDAFGAIVSNNLNQVMKLLTGLTIIFMIPSIVGALYGMNVPLPWQDHPHAFVFLCLLSLALALGGYWILRKMDWM